MYTMMGRRQGFLGNDTYTKLLLHFDGADEATSTTDSSKSGHAITFAGTAQIDTAQSVFGGSSLLLDGDSDYITTPIDSDFDFGTGNFTIDFRIRFANTAGDQYQLHARNDLANNNKIFIYTDGTAHRLFFYAEVGGAAKAHYYCSWTPATNTWYHVEITRSTTNLYMFIDGTSQNLTTLTAIGSNDIGVDDGGDADIIYIGCQQAAGDFVNGHIEEYRVSKGIARHTANFTPQYAPYR